MQDRLEVALLPQQLTAPAEPIAPGEEASVAGSGADAAEVCAVVIDVLRATTVMTTAGDHGATSMTTCGEIEAARELASRSAGDASGGRPLLCGERHCRRIDGFDLGNSPAEYSRDVVGGRPLVLPTTNGTRAIRAARHARRLLVASFLNLSATATAISDQRHIQLVCAGTNGQVSLEDVLLAGALVETLTAGNPDRGCNDSAHLARAAWRQWVCPEPDAVQRASGRAVPLDRGDGRWQRRLAAALRQSLGGRNLLAVGFESDVDRCSRIDGIDGIVQRDAGTESTFRFVPLATGSA